jgi:putative RNA 2'-phosphotransferase
VDVELEELQPPDFLYHGTATKYVSSIDKQGLIPKSRLYVHLSATTETAEDVGKRHGAPVIYTIHAKRMFDEGHKFFKSSNGVWLTKDVPTKYLVQKDVL